MEVFLFFSVKALEFQRVIFLFYNYFPHFKIILNRSFEMVSVMVRVHVFTLLKKLAVSFIKSTEAY